MNHETTPHPAFAARCASLVLAALLAPMVAKAETVSYEHLFNDSIALRTSGSGITPFGPARLSLISSGYFRAELPAFDGSLGTLNSARVTWSVDDTMSFTPNILSASSSVSQSLDGPSFRVNGTSYASMASRLVQGTALRNTPYSSLLHFENTFLFDATNQPALFSQFSAGPTVILSNPGSVLAAFPAIFPGGTFTVDGRVSVTYDYTPNAAPPGGNDVPEPGSLALVAAGLAAAWARSRR